MRNWYGNNYNFKKKGLESPPEYGVWDFKRVVGSIYSQLVHQTSLDMAKADGYTKKAPHLAYYHDAVGAVVDSIKAYKSKREEVEQLVDLWNNAPPLEVKAK